MAKTIIGNNEVIRFSTGEEVALKDIPASIATTDTVNQGDITANRPASPVDYQMFFDTTLGKPIWYDGTNWVDATGTIA